MSTVPLSKSLIKHAIFKKCRKETRDTITSSKIKHSNNALILHEAFNSNLPTPSKKSLRHLTQFTSGQNHLAWSLSKRDRDVVPECRKCKESPETGEHVLTSCPGYSFIRQSIYGLPTLELAEMIKEFPINFLSKFINQSGIEDSDYVLYYIHDSD